ncbi:MAG: acetoacetate--CoA ligase [Alphaproteobacteria bacterium]|nr:acetoacetate--CoA ligase [Alphaproteobacteria bacterium]MBM3732380.1 acetoacetate--CoA ligase [Acidimicrobiia bacterium]
MSERPLWTPSPARIRDTNLAAFRSRIERDYGTHVPDYAVLHRFSLEQPEKFWTAFKDFAGLKAETWGTVAIRDKHRMPGAAFFPDARLNFAENLLSRDDNTDALVFWGESEARRRLSWRELRAEVSRVAAALEGLGVQSGDRIAGYLPNMPEAIVAMLATASLGAVWSSCSPDFGVQGVLDRFGQIAPVVLFAVDGYPYNGKTHDVTAKTAEIAGRIPDLKRVVVAEYMGGGGLDRIPKAESWERFIAPYPPGPVRFRQVPFNHPLYILYSSGTTGVPKCFIHGAGGTLLKHVAEQRLHCDIRSGDRVFYFSTTGWMMWNWLATCLAAGATLLLYDGSPFHPDGNVLFDFADAERATLFGTSAKFLDAARKAQLAPIKSHRLETVRTLTSTGSPLAPEGFDYVYANIKTDVHLASIAGGTDICGCFVAGDPTAPVWRGEIQAAGLGMAVEVFGDDGRPLPVGEKGELVCTRPFPSLPLGFWNDPGDARYRAAYFERFPGAWHHGDWIARTAHGGYIIYGRSDATLNPGGVRIGTAEIYRVVETLDEIQESLAIGQEWDNDVRIVLFVVPRKGIALDDALCDKIKRKVREGCSPRHVPARIVQVADIPRTKSGKITELAVRDVVHGRPVKNKEALANPEALDLYRNLPALRS